MRVLCLLLALVGLSLAQGYRAQDPVGPQYPAYPPVNQVPIYARDPHYRRSPSFSSRKSASDEGKCNCNHIKPSKSVNIEAPLDKTKAKIMYRDNRCRAIIRCPFNSETNGTSYWMVFQKSKSETTTDDEVITQGAAVSAEAKCVDGSWKTRNQFGVLSSFKRVTCLSEPEIPVVTAQKTAAATKMGTKSAKSTGLLRTQAAGGLFGKVKKN